MPTFDPRSTALHPPHAAHQLHVLATPIDAQEVRVFPRDVVYTYDNLGEGTPATLSTAILHHVAVVNTSDRPMTVDGLTIRWTAGDTVLGSVEIPTDVLERSAEQYAELAQAGLLKAYAFQFHTDAYLGGVAFSASTTLAPGSALVVDRTPLLFSRTPDELTVTAHLTDSNGTTDSSTEVSTDIAVARYQQKNGYHFPTHGRWFVAAAPSLHSHHRWAVLQEFALDLVRLGAGTRTHRDDGSKLRHYHAYGAPIVASADGVVVSVANDHPESDANLQQPDESDAAYIQRSMVAQRQLIARGLENVMGNHVILEHPGGEYSHYLHLQPGSVTVEPGQRVRRGQPLGTLGHSGNSTEPHLHFHVTDSPDLVTGRSLPVEFANLRLWPAGFDGVRHLHSGQIVIADEPAVTAPRPLASPGNETLREGSARPSDR
ncbi:MAG: M23 family metallopeptidase [Acidobacteriota bacterium]